MLGEAWNIVEISLSRFGIISRHPQWRDNSCLPNSSQRASSAPRTFSLYELNASWLWSRQKNELFTMTAIMLQWSSHMKFICSTSAQREWKIHETRLDQGGWFSIASSSPIWCWQGESFSVTKCICQSTRCFLSVVVSHNPSQHNRNPTAVSSLPSVVAPILIFLQLFSFTLM